MVHVPGDAGGGRVAAPRRAGEAEEGHLLKGVVPEVSRLVEEGAEEGAIMHKGMFPCTLHVRAPHEGGCGILSNPPWSTREQRFEKAEDKPVMHDS